MQIVVGDLVDNTAVVFNAQASLESIFSSAIIMVKDLVSVKRASALLQE